MSEALGPVVAERDAAIQALGPMVAERDATIQALGPMVAERDATIEGLYGDIAERDALILELGPPPGHEPSFADGRARSTGGVLANGSPVHRRLLGNQADRYETFIRAACEYVDRWSATNDVDRLFRKPFDDTHGNTSFYAEMYQVLNLLKVLALPDGARVLEVGSGPGWVTEILMNLGFQVDALEPSETMIAAARERIAGSILHRRLKEPPPVEFHRQTLEACSLPDDTFDAVLLFEALHHVVDEEKGLAQCFRMLRPWGMLGVGGEAAWEPGNEEQEAFYRRMTASYGALESPFTSEYLDYCLRKHRFEEIVRYHVLNGLVPTSRGNVAVRRVAELPAEEMNTVTARKPGPCSLTTDVEGLTLAAITLLDVSIDEATREARLRVTLRNRGETAWLHASPIGGQVTLALRQGPAGTPALREAHPRQRLPRIVAPGEELVLEAVYSLPRDFREGVWHLDLVNEGHYFFSSRGTEPASVRFG